MRIPLVALVLASTVLSSASAKVIKVPSAQFPTIQSGIDAALEKDTVLVKAGNYPTPFVIQKRSRLKVRADGDVTIDASGQLTGISILGSDHITLTGFEVVAGNDTQLLIADCEFVTVSKCHLTSAASTSVLVTGGLDVTLSKNRIDLSAGRSIWVRKQTMLGAAGNADRITLEKNVINLPSGDGIEIEATDARVVKNRVNNATGTAIDVRPNCADGVFQKNRVSGSDAGFVIAGTGNTFKKERSTGCFGVAFFVSEPAVSMTKCRAIDANARGFDFATEADGSTITKCVSTGADLDGFRVAADGCTFSKCEGSGSGMLDLNDLAAGATTNTYTGCTFGTTSIP